MAQTETYRNALKPGQRVLWFEIERTLGQGGFGITYVAFDTNLKQPVALKEFLPAELAVREGEFEVHPLSSARAGSFAWGLEKFMDEARTLAHFDHPNIVKVYTVFEANNTAYMVMRYEDGLSLGSIYSKRRRLPERLLQHLVHPLLDGLERVHDQGFIHRDIKPDNIYLRQDGSPVLLDFGSARIAVGSETRALTSLVTPGYAPFEQYVTGSDRQGPWSDIYSLGATLYRGIAGIAPPDATNRSEALSYTGKDVLVPALEVGRERCSESFLVAVDAALAFRYDERPQSVAEWRRMFRARRQRKGRRQRDTLTEEIEPPKVRAAEFAPDAASEVVDEPTPPPLAASGETAAPVLPVPAAADAHPPSTPPPARPGRRRWPLAVLALAALGGVAWWWRPLPPPHTPGTPLPDTDVAVESAAPPGTTAAPAEAVAVTTQGHEDATATTPPADACAVLAELPRLPDMAARVAAGSDTPRYAIDTIKLYGPGNAAYTRLLEDAGGELEARRATLAATHGAGNRLSAADIEALAELLTDTARERGLLATAIAPMQFLDAHELALTVLPWRFGAVRLSGVPSEFRAANQAVAARVLGAALADAPRAHSLKRALLATILDTDFHGSAFAVLEPGATLASFDVVLKWQDAKPAFDPATVDVDRLYIYAVAGSGIRLPVTQVGDADAVPGGADVDDYARQVVDLFAPLAGEPALDCRRQALLGAYRDAARERVATGTGDDIADSRPR